MTCPPRSKALFGTGLALAGSLLGCSAKVNTVEVVDAEAPTPLTYTIDFQNQANAVGSALVQVVVYDASKHATDTASRITYCSDIVQRRQARRDFPSDAYPRVYDSALVSPCELISSDASQSKGRITLPYGTYAVLVTAQQAAGLTDEILIGCGVGDVSASGAANVTNIPLDAFSQFVAVPKFPQCNRLVDRCNSVANCPPK